MAVFEGLGLQFESAMKEFGNADPASLATLALAQKGNFEAIFGVRYLHETIQVDRTKCLAWISCLEFARSIAALSTDAAELVAKSVSKSGFGKGSSPRFGGISSRVVRWSSPTALHNLAMAAKNHGLESTFEEMLNSNFLHLIPREFDSPILAEALLKTFAKKERKGSELDLLLKNVFLNRVIKSPEQTTSRAYQAVLFKMATSVQPIEKQKVMLTINGERYLMSLDRTQTELKLKPLTQSQAKSNEKKSEKFIRDLESRKQQLVAEVVARRTMEANPDSIFIASVPMKNINHQALVIGDTVYDIGSPYLKSQPLSVWLESWENAHFVQVRPTEEKFEALLKYLDNHSGESGNPYPKDRDPNCASVVACALGESGIIKFPSNFTTRDAKGQLSYLRNQVGRDPQIVSIFGTEEFKNKTFSERDKEGLKVFGIILAGFGAFGTSGLLVTPTILDAIDSNRQFNPRSLDTFQYMFFGSPPRMQRSVFFQECERICQPRICADFGLNPGLTDQDISCILPDPSKKRTNGEAFKEIQIRFQEHGMRVD